MEPSKREPYVFEVPIGYVEGMRVPGVVFATDELFERARQDRAVDQVANVATLPGIVGASIDGVLRSMRCSGSMPLIA